MNSIKKTATTALAVVTLTASTMAVTTTTAQAGKKNFIKGLVAGAIITGVVGAASRAHSSSRNSYHECWYERQKRWDEYGRPYFVRVKICD